jgi:hypothetical protein
MSNNYIMENSSNYELVENKNSILQVLSDINELTTENDNVINDVHKYTQELDTMISQGKNEFENLTQSEINDKLDNILDQVLNDPNNTQLLEQYSNSGLDLTNIEIDNGDNGDNGNNKDNADNKDNEDNANNLPDIQNQIQMLNQLTSGLNDTIMSLFNMNPDAPVPNNSNGVVVETEPNANTDTDMNADSDSDGSTINPNDLETESESESDLDEYESGKVKSESSNGGFDPTNLFKSIPGLNIENMINDLQNMGNLPAMGKMFGSQMPAMSELSSPENMEKMKSQLGNMSEIFKQVDFGSMFKMMEQMNNFKTGTGSIEDDSNNDDPDDLASFVIDEQPNSSSQTVDDNEISDSESYDKTDDESDELGDSDGSGVSEDSENEQTDNKSGAGVGAGIGGMFGNLNLVNSFINGKTGINFDISKLTSMFGLFGSKTPEDSVISKSVSEEHPVCKNESEDDLSNFISNSNSNPPNENYQTDSDVNYDERNDPCIDSESGSGSGSESESGSELKPEPKSIPSNQLTECLDQNKKMIDDLSQMMNKLGINLVDIEELANKKRVKVKHE